MDTSSELKKSSVKEYCPRCIPISLGFRRVKLTAFGHACYYCGRILTSSDKIPVMKNSSQENGGLMNQKEFEKIFSIIVGKCENILIERAKRYASDDNRLRNFYNVAKEQHLPVARIPTLFSAKQREAFNEALQDNVSCFTLDIWEEWVVDQINYLILTYAIVKQESENASTDE